MRALILCLLAALVSAAQGGVLIKGTRSVVGQAATVTWNAPIRDGDGGALSDLANYRVDCGTTRGGPYTITSGLLSSATLTWTSGTVFTTGTWYCAVSALDSGGNKSFYSTEASKVIP